MRSCTNVTCTVGTWPCTNAHEEREAEREGLSSQHTVCGCVGVQVCVGVWVCEGIPSGEKRV